MTREEIMTLDMEGVQARGAEIAAEAADLEKCGDEVIEERKLEMDALEERKKAIEAEAIEKRAKMLEVVEKAEVIEEPIQERKTMNNKEYRSSQEYIDAYVEYVKKGYDLDKMSAEKRATLIMSENATNGIVPVPTYVEDRIRTAWENDEIMRRVRRTYLPGNVEVGVEASASPAVVHEEGGEAIDPENLVIGIIRLVPEYLKKMVHVTHTALALSGTAFLDYLYDEIEYRLVELAGTEVLAAISGSSLTAQYNIADTISTADIIAAEGLLSGAARNPVLIISRSDAAVLKAAALSAGYAYDPFDGLPVIYKAMQSNHFIIADLDAVQANFPEGGEPKFIFDELTMAAQNVVRIIGRLLMAADVVNTGMTVFGSKSGD